MKNWSLDSHQRVSVDRRHNVYFKHDTHGKETGITLSRRQFLNLNDIIMDLDTFRNMKYYPLGGNVWLQYYQNRIQLYHCRLHIHFTFHDTSWMKYLGETHRRILSFIRHGATRIHDRQHAASHENLFKGGSRDISSTSSQQQAVSRPTSNAGSETEQYAKHSNLSERNSTNSGRPFSFIGAVHALGTTKEPATDMEEGEVCDVQSDCGQLSDFYSIE